MKKWLAGLLLFSSIVLLTLSIYSLMGMYLEEKKDNQTYETIRNIYEKPTGTEPFQEEKGNPIEEVDEGLLALHGENPDCVAWLAVEGTVIDYPVMYRPQDKNYYLKRDFYGEWSANGSLFVAEHCDPDACDNLIIYGHHMNSGKMFAALEDYKSEDFYQEHKYISLKTLHGNEKCEIMAAFSTSVYTKGGFVYYSFAEADEKQEYDAFVSECKERSLYETDCQAEYGEKLLTLSTCEYSQKNGRMVVVAKQINDNRRGGNADGREGI